MEDTSTLDLLAEAAHTDAVIYAALQQYAQGHTTLEQALAGAALILSVQLKETRQALDQYAARRPRWHWPEY